MTEKKISKEDDAYLAVVETAPSDNTAIFLSSLWFSSSLCVAGRDFAFISCLKGRGIEPILMTAERRGLLYLFLLVANPYYPHPVDDSEEIDSHPNMLIL